MVQFGSSTALDGTALHLIACALQIKKSIGVTEEDYNEAFHHITEFMGGDGVSFSEAQFDEIGSSGASGSYFYFTPNRRFVVKQVCD